MALSIINKVLYLNILSVTASYLKLLKIKNSDQSTIFIANHIDILQYTRICDSHRLYFHIRRKYLKNKLTLVNAVDYNQNERGRHLFYKFKNFVYGRISLLILYKDNSPVDKVKILRKFILNNIDKSILIFPEGTAYKNMSDLCEHKFHTGFIHISSLEQNTPKSRKIIIPIYQYWNKDTSNIEYLEGFPSTPVTKYFNSNELTNYYKDLLIELQNEAHGNKDYYHELLKNLQIKAENYSTIDSTI